MPPRNGRAPAAAHPALLAPHRRAGDRLRALLCLLLALLALALAPAPARAADPVVAIMRPGGTCELRQVPPQALAALNATLEQARQDAAGLAQRLATDAAAAHYAGAREAVPGFGAWAYDWVQSYITAYRIAGRMVASAAAALRGDSAGLADGVVEQMAEPMRRAFVERVLSRAAPPEALRRDLDMAATLVEAGWNEALAQALAPLRAYPGAAPSPDAPALRLDPEAAGRAAAVSLRAAGGQAAGGASPGSDPASLFFHSLRPIAARVSALMLRATEAGSLVAAVGAVGYRFGGVPGLAAGTAGGVGAYWGIDWAFNRADAALNREDFEAQSLAVIARAEAAVAEEARREVLAALDARVARLATRGGCPQAPATGAPATGATATGATATGAAP